MHRMSATFHRIAILDDELQMRKAIARLLHCHGHQTKPFATGLSLLEAIEAHEEFHAILLDLHMPGLNGFQVLERLSRLAHRPAVIVITGKDEPGNAQKARELGACSYLLQPIPESVLLKAIEQASETCNPPLPALNEGSISSKC